MTPRIAEVLHSHHRTKRLVQAVSRYEQVARVASYVVSPAVREHVRIARIRDGVCEITATSAAWLTRLRYEIDRIEAALIEAFPDEIQSVRLARRTAKVGGSTAPAPTPSSKPSRRVSPESAYHVKSAAQSASDPDIAEALNRLADGLARRVAGQLSDTD